MNDGFKIVGPTKQPIRKMGQSHVQGAFSLKIPVDNFDKNRKAQTNFGEEPIAENITTKGR